MANDNGNFEIWKREVNKFVELMCGLSADDLDDAPYMDMFQDRVSPKAAAKRAIKRTREG